MAVDNIAREAYAESSLATTRFNPDEFGTDGASHTDDLGYFNAEALTSLVLNQEASPDGTLMPVEDIARKGYAGSSLATTRFNPDDERYGGHIDDSGLDTYTLMMNARGFDEQQHRKIQRELAYTPSTSMTKARLAEEFGDGASHTDGLGYKHIDLVKLVFASITANRDWVSPDGEGALAKDDHGC